MRTGLACWSNYFDVEAYFRRRLPPEDFEKECFVRLQPTKLCTLMELIEKARNLRTRSARNNLLFSCALFDHTLMKQYGVGAE